MGRRLSMKKRAALYAELALLLQSGVDLKSSLYFLREGRVKGVERAFLGDLYDGLVAGKSLHECFKGAGQFSVYEVSSVQIGEETGRLTRVVKELGVYYAEQVEQMQRLRSAFAYPLVVLGVALAVMGFMVYFVVPMFEGVFARFGRELPVLTKGVLSVAAFLREEGGGVLVGIGMVGGGVYLFRKHSLLRRYLIEVGRRLPVVGRWLVIVHVGRFCQTMALLVGAGIPLLQAVKMVQKMLSFYPLREVLEEVATDLLRGKTLHESLAKHSLFDPCVCLWVKLGEEVNGLEETFTRLSGRYKRELEQKLELMNKLLEPVLIVVIGGIVAIILIAMYFPMFTMGDSLYV